jgi:ribose-phosphate pyrophosphokinase
MKILSGSGYKILARKLADIMSCEYVEPYIKYFNDGELQVKISEDFSGEEVIIVQSTSRPVNDNLMELLLLIDAVRHSGARRITAIIPYFGYGRQDHKSNYYGSIAARLVASMFDAVKIDQIITIDLHSYQLEGFFRTSILNLNPISIFAPIIESYNNPVLVAPDIGAVKRVCKASENFGTDMVIINKNRYGGDKYQLNYISGEVKGRECIIIDDIIDSGYTLSKAAEFLMQKGASSINAFVTHALLASDVAQDTIDNSYVQNLYITDSIALKKAHSKKFQELSIIKLLTDAIK